MSVNNLYFDKNDILYLNGIIDITAKFIESFQLLDKENHARFIDQFKLHTDSVDHGWKGEYWGKMMRGAAITYSYTKNSDLYDVLKNSVLDMLSIEDSFGRISSYSIEKEFTGWDLWCRKYVLLGMEYFLEICNDEPLREKIIKSLCHGTDYLISKLGDKTEGKLPITNATQNWRGLNSSSILEPVVRLYKLTGEERYFNFAEYIVSTGANQLFNLFETAYEDKAYPYQYPVTKAYEMMSCFEGLLEFYTVTGNEKYRETVIRFADKVFESDVTIIGCSGCTHELFDHSAARQTDTAYNGTMQETCVTVTWMKLCYRLLLLTGDSKYADYLEQSLYNAYLGSVNTEKIINKEYILNKSPNLSLAPLPFDSYSALTMGERGRSIGGFQIMPDKTFYGCCACIGSAGIGLAANAVLLHGKDELALNIYCGGTYSTKTPQGKELNILCDTDYPSNGEIKFTIKITQSEKFKIKLRIPSWSKRTKLTVNSKPITVTDGYTVVEKEWFDGDEIELSLDFRTKVIHAPKSHTEILMNDVKWDYDFIVPKIFVPSDDAPYHIALKRGPLVLARDARLGEDVDQCVDIDFDRDGYVNPEVITESDFDTLIKLRIPEKNGKSFLVIDYSSAGKTWDKTSRYGCWMNTEKIY